MPDAKLLTQWAAGQFWVDPNRIITQRARIFLNRIHGFEERIGILEAEIISIEAQIIQLQIDVLANSELIAINTAAIAILEDKVAANEAAIIEIQAAIVEIDSRLDALEDTSNDIVEVNSTYQILVSNKIVNCLGTFTVTLPSISSALPRPITISSTSGSITVTGNATVEPPVTLTTGQSASWYPARSQWFRV